MLVDTENSDFSDFIAYLMSWVGNTADMPSYFAPWETGFQPFDNTYMGDVLYVEVSSVAGLWEVTGAPDIRLMSSSGTTDYVSGVPILDPSTMLLLGSSLIGLVGFRSRKFFERSLC